MGRCGHCGEWDSLDEELTAVRPAPGGGVGIGAGGAGGPGTAEPPQLLADVGDADRSARPTGLAELDRVLGGGLVPGSVTLLAGEPGIGKSTLLLQMLAAVARAGRRSLLVSAEEATAQVRMRAARLGVADDGLWVAGAADLGSIRQALAEMRPDVVVIDSIQTVGERNGGFAPGSPAALRLAAQSLCDDARATGAAVVLVGHVTKDGSIAGPRLLEHLVDTVLSFEGDRHYALRTLRAVKHRFGPVGELGLWEMAGDGLREVGDATSFLLADRRAETPGSCVYAGLEGRRPLLVEVQALVVPEGAGRRCATRVEAGRLAQLLAVLDQRAGVGLRQHDVYVSAVGGVRIAEPGADLAVATAVASAFTGLAVPADTVVVGEIGLGGELRQAPQAARRLAEAARMGFRRGVVPAGTEEVDGIGLCPAEHVAAALDLSLTGRPVPRPRLRVVGGQPLAGGS